MASKKFYFAQMKLAAESFWEVFSPIRDTPRLFTTNNLNDDFR
jgi:hypothetical protein